MGIVIRKEYVKIPPLSFPAAFNEFVGEFVGVTDGVGVGFSVEVVGAFVGQASALAG